MTNPCRCVFFFLTFFLLSIPSTFASRIIQVVAIPKSGVAPLEVSLRCIVASDTSPPSNYIMDFGDGSEPETVETNSYSYTFTHTYESGYFKPVCTSNKTIGTATESDPAKVIVAKWQFETLGDIDTSPAIGANGTVYTGSEDGNLYAIDPETGDEIWRFSAGVAILSSPTIAVDDTIYFGTQNSLYALNPNGDRKWSFDVGDAVFSSPAVSRDGRVVYFGSTNGILYALNATGTLKWQFQTGDKIVSSPAIGHDGIEDVVYVGSLDRHVYAIAADNGGLKWKFKANAEIYGSPAIGVDGRIYIGECKVGSAESYDFKFFCLNVDGSKYWDFSGGTGFYGSPAIGSDGKIYVGNWDGYLYALNPGGTKTWSVRTSPPSDINSSPALSAADVIYVGSKDGNLYAFQSPAVEENNKQDWVFQTGDIIRSSPVIDAAGTIYFGSRNNSLYAINPGDSEPADSAWPMFRQNAAHTGTLENIALASVISSVPGKNSTGVDIQTTEVSVNFSPLMDASLINIDSFLLEQETDSGKESVEGYAVLVYKRYNNSAYHVAAVFNRLNQNEPLEYNTTYHASISYYSERTIADGESDIADGESEAEAETEAEDATEEKTYSFSFTTEVESEEEAAASGSGGEIGCFINTMIR